MLLTTTAEMRGRSMKGQESASRLEGPEEHLAQEKAESQRKEVTCPRPDTGRYKTGTSVQLSQFSVQDPYPRIIISNVRLPQFGTEIQ